MNRQQASKQAVWEATRQHMFNAFITWFSCDWMIRISFLLSKIETGQLKLLSSRYICLRHIFNIKKYQTNSVWWCRTLISFIGHRQSYTNTNQTQFGKMKSTINIVGWIWFRANLFIYWRVRIHIHANWIGKKTKSC